METFFCPNIIYGVIPHPLNPRPPILSGIIEIPQNPENQEFLITPYFPFLKITQSRGYTWPV
jgi:hypothetical protein